MEVSGHTQTQQNTAVEVIVDSTVKKNRAFCLTWNNPPDTADTLIPRVLEKGKWCFQRERGESGTEHIQGCVRFTNARTLKQVRDLFVKCHVEVCKDWKAAVKYCSKDETRIGETVSNCLPKRIRDLFDRSEMADWMVEIEAIISEPPHPRKIYWYWEPDGGRGKTTFCRHHCLKNEKAFYMSGKAHDILSAIAKAKHKPELIFLDIPRSIAGYASYQALENLKNGIFFSGKYEGCMVLMEIPHIICFANCPPDTTMLSEDRWVIREI